MLPLHQAYEVRTAVLEYIKATYRFKDAGVEREFHRFVSDEKTGLFRGPYISLKTPFVKAKEDEELPLDIVPPFAPHLHQVKAFERLTTQGGHEPQPTLLTTGTGSGKTECFLYPVLDYVWQQNRHGRRAGVKVIILYPMNALATDQAKRLAETIYGDERLRGNVTAGLFIGESNDPQLPHDMGEDHVIEYRHSIVSENTPDILLTNFKMLDYALMRQEFMSLWRGNIDTDTPMLRFLVLDELHTYDGAQGTDVANLIRRLKLKLHLTEGHLTPIGTSATIGNGDDSKAMLCQYATDVFGETFTEESIIEEHRVGVDDFFGTDALEQNLPAETQLKRLSRESMKDTADYLRTARQVWLPQCPDNPVAVGEALKRLQIVKDLLATTTTGIKDLSELRQWLGLRNEGYRRLLTHKNPDYGGIVIESLLALIAVAKAEGGRFPLLTLQVQLWQRELSGIQRFVQPEAEFTWKDSIPRDERISLPMYFCRDCGTSGWVSTKNETETRYGTDASKASRAFMEKEPEVRLLNTDTTNHEPIADYVNELTVVEHERIHPEDLTFGNSNEDGVMQMIGLRRGTMRNTNRLRFDRCCPLCMSDSLSIVGGKTSTLSSVGVSQIMSSDFDTDQPRDRKMLTFTNSVQDAAHLAGFYEVRTFRFVFRQSIQQYMKTIGHAVTLRQLQEGFKAYWKEQLDGDEYYYRFIPGELVEKIDLSRQYRDPNTGELTEAFKKEFDLRVDWEICSEFGLMSQIGRTLEKMGSSATFFRREDLQHVFDQMVPWLRENGLEWLARREDLFLPFVNGLLHRLRMRGGIDHEFLRLFRTQKMCMYLLNWAKDLSKIHFLRKGFGHSRVPHLVSTQFAQRDEVADTTTIRNNRQNWFSAYFIRSLVNPSGTLLYDPERINDFYRQLLKVMAEQHILDQQTASDMDNYAISPDALYIEPSVRQQKCEQCESRLFTGRSDTLSERTYCLDFKCGTYKYSTRENIGVNYYQRVYDRNRSPRIYANEHTGLLDRSLREQLERDFKEHPTFHSCNVLTATSTLEMGIDIGSLNVVANTGIPPKPSNFLQRVGRAGRKEGSALVVNYAKGGEHDMYYFAEPKEMMEGAVSTPGCFLEARDILRRHFYAFCIDSWTSSNAGNTITPQVRYLGLSHQLLNDPNFFINRIKAFVEDHLDELTQQFRSQYPSSAQPVMDELFATLHSGIFFKRVNDVFLQLVITLDRINQERATLVKELKTLPKNDKAARQEKLQQGRALKSRQKAILDSSVIEFMTNEGLLPNYAFPETGIKLTASIFPSQALGDDSPAATLPQDLELVRAASQGIHELAPDNSFYTQKLRLKVNGLSLNNQADDLKTFRYCSECDAIAEETTPEYSLPACPKCGSQSWRGNKHPYLRFITAISNMRHNDATMDDRDDERTQNTYHTMKHFEFVHTGAVTSYGLKKVGFGIEFCKNVNLTEVNYGNRQQMSNTIEVNGTKQISGNGFVTCRYCGRSHSVLFGSEDVRDLHYPYCSHKEVGYPADQDNADTWQHLFLYRTMQTEAIKVLLPIQLFETEEASQLFRAGLELGMRHYYQSNPEHLRTETYREYNKATQDFDNYLVIYDTIPGGTGYLSKLYNTKEFSKLIHICYEHIRDCECRHEGKDGCYHCILTYGNQWNRKNLSRARAEELFEKIDAACDSWEQIDGSIGTITQNGVIEDSELEQLFVKAMKKVCHDKAWTWEKHVDPTEETYTYELVVKDDNSEIRYTVVPQYKLGPAQGVSHVTIADFQFICMSARVGHKQLDPQAIPQWSVYVDGYAFHASKEHMGFYNDFKRREAIRLSDIVPRYSWTLTWNDIKPYVEKEGGDGYDELHVTPDAQLIDDFENTIYRRKGNLDRLLFVLEHPDRDVLAQEVFCCLASCFTDTGRYLSSYDQVDDAVRDNAKSQYSPTQEDLEEGHFFTKTAFISRTSLTNGSAWYAYDQEDNYGQGIRYSWGMKEGLPEINRDDWETFWHRYNLLQFFKVPEQTEKMIDLDEVLVFFPGLEDIVTQLVENHIDFDTEGDFALKDADGIILAEAAIKIQDKDIVIDDFTDREADVQLFREHGYTVITKNNFNINDIK